jgi:protein CpxP
MKAKMKSILSAEQFTKWEAMKEKYQEKRGNRNERPRGEKPE